MRPSLFTGFLGALLFVSSASASASTNLIENPGFLATLAPWTVPSYTTGEWNAFEHGEGGTGSALLTSAGNPGDAPNTAIQQCVPVSGGHSYAYGAAVYIPADVAPGAEITPVLDVRFFSGAGCTGNLLFQDIGSTHRIFRDAWNDVQSHAVAPAGSVSALASFGAVEYQGNAGTETIHVYVDDAFFGTDALCVSDGSHLCLGGRFLVYGDWAVPAQSREGFMRAYPATADSGLFWFFAPDNLEVFVKVLNACSDPFNHYWVFASGLTNVQVSLNVDDLESGQTKHYENLAGTAFPPIQDTSAFATCP